MRRAAERVGQHSFADQDGPPRQARAKDHAAQQALPAVSTVLAVGATGGPVGISHAGHPGRLACNSRRHAVLLSGVRIMMLIE
mmetsp:Transcript_53068/g.116440  ORF Transcript_53068/g.116440 Transcript_53068/m.116440 type:complete len:83 (+) Transcript_53068:448-696(+)